MIYIFERKCSMKRKIFERSYVQTKQSKFVKAMKAT